MSELRKLTWTGGELRLLTAAGLTLGLKGNGPELFSWAPKLYNDAGAEIPHVPALDVELRLEPIFGSAQDIPIWRYNVQIGHADASYRYPGGGPGPIEWPILPHRGMVARLSARELRVEVFCEGFISGDPAPASTAVQVSVQPAFASELPSITRQDVQISNVKRFPAEANEWRLRQLDGQPLAIGTTDVVLVALSGAPIAAPVDAALFFDWQPIPALAAFWVATVPPCQADFR